jgi:hypothetical protein
MGSKKPSVGFRSLSPVAAVPPAPPAVADAYVRSGVAPRPTETAEPTVTTLSDPAEPTRLSTTTTPIAAIQPPAGPAQPPTSTGTVDGSDATGKAKKTVHGSRVVLERADGRRLRRTTIYMDFALAERVGVYAVRRGLDQTDVIKAALEEYLTRNESLDIHPSRRMYI